MIINRIINIAKYIINWIINYNKKIELTGLIVLFFYAYFTLRLWRESKSQTYQLISPFVIFHIKKEVGTRHKFIVENIGKGVAFNISINDFTMRLLDSGDILKLVFDKINILKPNNKIELAYKEYINDKETDFRLLSSHLNPEYQRERNFIFIITYYNVQGERYFTKFQTGKDGVKVLRKGIGKYSCWKKLIFWIQDKIRSYISFVQIKRELKKKQ